MASDEHRFAGSVGATGLGAQGRGVWPQGRVKNPFRGIVRDRVSDLQKLLVDSEALR